MPTGLFSNRLQHGPPVVFTSAPAMRAFFWSVLVILLALPVATPARAQYGYSFGRNKIQYEDFDWQVLKTAHFDIYYYSEMRDLAEMGAAWAEEQYEELENRFGTSLVSRVPMIFYASNIHFKQTNITPGFIPDGVGGFFEFLKGRVVVPANGDLTRFRRVIRHEIAHVFTYARTMRVLTDHRIPPDRFLPLWFTEGLAEYWSGEPDYQHAMMMRDALASNYLMPLENIDRIAGTYLMYKEGEAIFRFISETYGEERILDLMDNAWRDRDFRKVMSFTLHEDFKAISDKWSAWLKAQYYPALADASLTTLISEGISTEGFSAKPVAYTHPDGQRTVYVVGNKQGYTNIYEIDVDSAYAPTSKPRVLIRGERSDQFEAFHVFESQMDVSTDGKLAFVTKMGERDAVHVYDLRARKLLASYRFDSLVAIYSPAWSPDGQKLVFNGIARSGFSDLYVYDPRHDALRALTDDPYDDKDPAWSPEGQRIAFSSDRADVGENGAYTLFLIDADAPGAPRAITYGDQKDLNPEWSPDGRRLAFISARRDSTGRFGAQNLWVADLGAPGEPLALTAAPDHDVATPPVSAPLSEIVEVTAAAHDPFWTDDGVLLFSSFEHYRFTARALTDVDSLLAAPQETTRDDLAASGETWTHARIGLVQEETAGTPYKRKYSLDIAQGGVSQNAVFGASGGALLAFSDLLGNDYWYTTLYSTSQGQSDFLKSLNVAVTRVNVGRRANTAYGLYRYGGPRYDITDPDASTDLPILYETLYGGFAAVSYPLSMFRRIEVGTSLTYSDKEVIGLLQREAVLLSNSLSLVQDNALYNLNGPMEGWRAFVTAAYTTDLWYSNVSYFTLIGDVRHYLRLGRDVTFASWVAARVNEGREARLFYLGGSWDLRGQRLFRVRGQKVWHTSHELRFPIVNAPSAYVPLLAPFGIANLRGALFVDAAHAWNERYDEKIPAIHAGETLGALGGGLRMNLFGAIVLRYDIGYAYTDGFKTRERFFRQFFFGYDF